MLVKAIWIRMRDLNYRQHLRLSVLQMPYFRILPSAARSICQLAITAYLQFCTNMEVTLFFKFCLQMNLFIKAAQSDPLTVSLSNTLHSRKAGNTSDRFHTSQQVQFEEPHFGKQTHCHQLNLECNTFITRQDFDFKPKQNGMKCF